MDVRLKDETLISAPANSKKEIRNCVMPKTVMDY